MSDDEKRKIYDKGGEEALSRDGGGGGGDPFSSFFGGGGSPFGDFFGFDQDQGEREIPKGADITIDTWVTLEELYVGNFIEVSYFQFFLSEYTLVLLFENCTYGFFNLNRYLNLFLLSHTEFINLSRHLKIQNPPFFS